MADIHLLFKNKTECCGCEACAVACPMGIIRIEADVEGFYYPQIINETGCLHCNRCQVVCPEKHIEVVKDFSEQGFGGYLEDEKDLKLSASGGLGIAIARKFVDDGGIVYGVEYNTDCTEVLFGRATSAEELEKFRTSKYVQARKHEIYKSVQEDLRKNSKVLFIGLPCECRALQLFLAKKYENLYICALMCHGPTSQAVHLQYCEGLKLKHPGIIREFSVRNKKEGWKPYYIRAKYEDGYEYFEKFSESDYGVAFLYMKRPSCNVCQIKRDKVHADIIIGDYHLAFSGKFKPYNPNGVSSAIVQNKKGIDLIQNLDKFLLEEIPVKNVLYSEAYYKAIPARKNRAEFGRVFSEEGLHAACSIKSIERIEKELAFKQSLKRKGAKIKKLIFRKKD